MWQRRQWRRLGQRQWRAADIEDLCDDRADGAPTANYYYHHYAAAH
jgi:hypothetical protein